MNWKIGYHNVITVRTEHHPILKKLGIKLLYISDLHLTYWSGVQVEQMIHLVREQAPNVILLGGDYLDWFGGWQHLHRLLGSITVQCQVVAVSGNHDRVLRREAIMICMQHYGVYWIDQTSVILSIAQQKIQIDGRKYHLRDPITDFHIACLHEPRDLDTHMLQYDLILAGHLHGGQVVIWQNEYGLYPARWFYRWGILRHQVDHLLYLVSRGISDTIPVRFRCASEMVVVA
jgi:uncharacterized protein